MLILSRKVGQSIIIGDNIVKIRLLSRQGGVIRFGIEADKSISVHREEIFNLIKEKNQDLLDKKEIKENE